MYIYIYTYLYIYIYDIKIVCVTCSFPLIFGHPSFVKAAPPVSQKFRQARAQRPTQAESSNQAKSYQLMEEIPFPTTVWMYKPCA